MFGRDHHNERYALRVALAVFILLGDTPADVHAQTHADSWRFSSYAELASSTLYFSNGASSTTLRSLAAVGGVDLTKRTSPWSAGLFADYHYSDDASVDNAINTGAYVKVRFGRWDATSFAVRSVIPNAPSAWSYGAGLRYRVAEGHKLGLSATATASELDAATVVLGYSGELGHGLSLGLGYGAGIDSFRRRVAMVQLTLALF